MTTEHGVGMSATKFSKFFISRVLQGKEGTGFWTDTESRLGLSRTTGGATSYRVVLKVGGKTKTFSPRDPQGKTLRNSAATLTLDQAKRWAKEVVANATLGLAPVPERQTQTPCFAKLAETYLSAYAARHTAKSLQSETYAVQLASKQLGKLSVSDIDPPTITRMVESLSSNAQRRLAFGACKRVLDLGCSQGHLPGNPAASLKAPKPPPAKHRYPRLHELCAIWRACEKTRGVGADILRFAICLPLRANTITSLTWGEVHLNQRELQLRNEAGRKLSEAQRLPLPSLAAEILQARKPQKLDRDALVFGSDSPKNPGGQFSGWSAATNRIRTRSGIAGWSIHDFRRSMVSIVAELRPDISETHLDLLLTHRQSSTRPGIASVYQRASGFAGMRLAVDAWDALLREELNVCRS